MKLNLQATTKEEQKVKAYLEQNASEMLAEKIDNGVRVQKDGKTLLNKKTLSGFLKFACDEAKKQAEKGASSACIDDDTVYGWSVHYFEEDSIEGTLYNEDGTEYKAPMPKVTAKAPAVKTQPKPQPKPQMSMFDLLDAKPEDPAAEESDDEPTDEDYAEAAEQLAEEAALQADPETDEVISRSVAREPERNEGPRREETQAEAEDEFDISAFDTEALAVLDEMFGNDITLR
mgnify:CR=1 FL=1